MAKNIFLMAIVFLFSQSGLAYAEACNLPEVRQHYSNMAVQYTTNRPAGNCDSLGKIGPSSTVKLCAEVAQAKGYRCFQVADLEVRDSDHFFSRTTYRMCYACL